MTTTKPRVSLSQSVIALIHPILNAGRDEAHAVVTGVNDDGTVNVLVHPNTDGPSFRLTNLPLYDHRDEHDQAVADTYELLPGHKKGPKGEHIPGINPQTDQPWQPYDGLAWLPAAVLHAGDVTDPPAPAEPVDPVEAKLAELRAEKARREAAANDPRLAEIRALEAELAGDGTVG
jgi:hypothetical protein